MLACSEAWGEDAGVQISWRWRSLEAFGDAPLEDLAADADLLVIDHPFCGTAARSGCLRPLDTIIEADDLAVLADDAVGPSHRSYTFDGHQWALATDAACQVSAVRDDLLDSAAPMTWDDVVALARARPGQVALPLAPAQAISSFLTLCANAGTAAGASSEEFVDAKIGEYALDLLSELHRLGPPGTTNWEPPDALARLSDANSLVYIPITYGYVTYASSCRFLALPSAGHGPIGSVLGGAGLAVSASSPEPHLAAAFAVWASGAFAQQTVVAPAGGQPGSRAAWSDPTTDENAAGFYSGTRATIEGAWVRPRDAWWPPFQLAGGRLLSECLEAHVAPTAIFARLDSLYRTASGRLG